MTEPTDRPELKYLHLVNEEAGNPVAMRPSKVSYESLDDLHLGAPETEPEPEAIAPMRSILPSPSDPMGVAGELVKQHQTDAGELTLRHWRSTWMQWVGAHWTESEEKSIRSWLYKRLAEADYWYTDSKTGLRERKPWNPTRHKVLDVMDALAAVTHTIETTDTPSWLSVERVGTRKKPLSAVHSAAEIVSCTNGLLHVGTRELIAHTPQFWNTVSVPFEYNVLSPEPTRWLAFLEQLFPDDPDSIAALQEWFGYVLSGRTDLHKILLTIGPTRSGKGTIGRILTRLLGKANVAGPTLASLGTNFGLSPLLGKPLAIVSDARLAGPNVHQVVERLLSVSGEDQITVDRKFREPWTGKLSSRFFIISNELPRFGDASGAIANRFVVLVMTQSFLRRENTRLTEELAKELPGILSWALDGLERLTQQGRFTEPQSSRDAIVALHDLVSPVAAFVRDRCEVGIGYEVSVTDLFEAWKEWAEDNGHKRGSVQTLGRNIRAAVPTLRQVQQRDGDDRERHYVGIRLACDDRPANCANSNCRLFKSCARKPT
jgi:putative DNA primase/helicase